MNAFGKLANKREDLYKPSNDIFTAAVGGYQVYEAEAVKEYNVLSNRLKKFVRLDIIGSKGNYQSVMYQVPAFLMQDLANLAGGEKAYPLMGREVAPKYTAAKLSFFVTSSFGNKVPKIGGMAHPHLPQTYYLIARNNFVALS